MAARLPPSQSRIIFEDLCRCQRQSLHKVGLLDRSLLLPHWHHSKIKRGAKWDSMVRMLPFSSSYYSRLHSACCRYQPHEHLSSRLATQHTGCAVSYTRARTRSIQCIFSTPNERPTRRKGWSFRVRILARL